MAFVSSENLAWLGSTGRTTLSAITGQACRSRVEFYVQEEATALAVEILTFAVTL